MDYGASGNIQISLANGNIMKIPIASINISEEVNKTGIWQQVNEGNEKPKQAKSSKYVQCTAGRLSRRDRYRSSLF